ncbi:MAG: hypothetical protein QOF03_1460, partial [Alphaproteobacteria bacterium]|nr:hypothetical protein [Alphaproteobacteria bacterium]
MRPLLPALFLALATLGPLMAAPAADNLIVPGERVG